MKVLILGGHGFVGKSVQTLLDVSPEHEVRARSRVDGFDLADYPTTLAALHAWKPDAIINCSAHTGSLHYVSAHPATVLHDNLTMTLNLYRAVGEVCPSARIINPLSNCSYPGDVDRQAEGDWLRGEVHESVYAYGNAKRNIYFTARCYQKQYGIRSCNFLVPNIFGPGDHTDPNKVHAFNGMIIRMIAAKRAQKPKFEIWGSGKPIREWAYIADVAEILKRALTIEDDLVYPVNIAQERGYSIAESAERIAKALNFTGELFFNTSYQDGAPVKILDDARFRVLFPDFRFTDHEEGIQKTVTYYHSLL